jgi:hypothetical protein
MRAYNSQAIVALVARKLSVVVIEQQFAMHKMASQQHSPGDPYSTPIVVRS